MATPKTIGKLEKLLDQYLPGSVIDFDNDGQIVVYTGLTEIVEGELAGQLVPYEEDDDGA